MNETEIKKKLDYILKNGDYFQKMVISKCMSVVHFEVCKKNEPKSRKDFADYIARIERVFSQGTSEQISSLVGSLLVQEQNIPPHDPQNPSLLQPTQEVPK